ncbi:hypothetical protein LOC68_23250 [Blastopirellula sp. JC732]|uniref:Uncharacterized protein n=1 Tax=Blastopirellula sediminis TaxID=2894196 RepID=A0A9X1MRC9_9BACT|nr:hypothetical protein [Blastopirellula sediminis]MCC9605379.1 hypothetical protein [Blastopirellula sediminis]MCC9631321.1 hypothetical protein [Blastopirellula sediminis]
MSSQLFALYDSPRPLWLAKGGGAIVRKCLGGTLKGTLVFFVIAAVLIATVPENLKSPGHQAQLLLLWLCAVGIGLVFTLRFKKAIGGASGVAFDTFSAYQYESCSYEELAMVTIRYHRVGVAHYTFTIAKPTRQLQELDLFVRESLEQSLETKATLEKKEVMVALEEVA